MAKKTPKYFLSDQLSPWGICHDTHGFQKIVSEKSYPGVTKFSKPMTLPKQSILTMQLISLYCANIMGYFFE